jgi:hypothetical protein
MDWCENLGFCEPGEAECLLNDGDTKKFDRGAFPGFFCRLVRPHQDRRG